jgi:predicted ester cyclase
MGRLRDLQEEAFTKGYDANDLDSYSTYFAPDCEITVMGGTLDWQAFRQLLEGFLAAFPYSRHTIVNAVESGNVLASEIVWTGVHSNTMRSPGGSIPATGKEVNLPMCMVDTVEDGKIKTRHVYMDQMELLTQLGVTPA